MRCVECKFYDAGDPDEKLGICSRGGDTEHPTRDIYCGEAGDKEDEFIVRQNLYGIIDEIRT